MPRHALRLNTNRAEPIVIGRVQSQFSLGLREFWAHRDLLYVFVWRDIKVRYKQTVLGVLWALLQPFLSMIVFTFIFGRLAKVPSDRVPYPVFFFCGLLPWQFFAQGLIRCSKSLVDDQYLVAKIYFPRLLLPIAAILSGLPDFAVAFAMLIGIMIYYCIYLPLAILALVPLLLLAGVTAASIGIYLCALNVRYRDVGYAVPFLTQLWFFLTPIAYPANLVPAKWHALYALNPMTGVVEGFRWALLKGTPGAWGATFKGALATAVVLTFSLWFFDRAKAILPDVI